LANRRAAKALLSDCVQLSCENLGPKRRGLCGEIARRREEEALDLV